MARVLRHEKSLTPASRQKLNQRERILKSSDPAMKREMWDEMNREEQEAYEAAYWRKKMCLLRWPDGVRENRGGLHYCEGEPRHPVMTDQGIYVCADCGKSWDPVDPYFNNRSKLTWRQMTLAMAMMARGGYSTPQFAEKLGVTYNTANIIQYKLRLGPIAPGWDQWTRTHPDYN